MCGYRISYGGAIENGAACKVWESFVESVGRENENLKSASWLEEDFGQEGACWTRITGILELLEDAVVWMGWVYSLDKRSTYIWNDSVER